MDNPYIPFPMRIEEIILETEDRKIKTFILGFMREEDRERFTYVPGQFAESLCSARVRRRSAWPQHPPGRSVLNLA